uniref:hypothetical protein n=1 Tax=Nodularia chucula TaxID=3093667 RepID=UPI0039C5F409
THHKGNFDIKTYLKHSPLGGIIKRFEFLTVGLLWLRDRVVAVKPLTPPTLDLTPHPNSPAKSLVQKLVKQQKVDGN